MYHKLVSQNSQLKTDCQASEKKISRKEERAKSLEKNLREAKAKYEKLLNQCANLTSAIDLRQGPSLRAGPRLSRAAIRVPIKGGTRAADTQLG
jgi:predicted RNase H-like nuclease (RuvC/YqgF family)